MTKISRLRPFVVGISIILSLTLAGCAAPVTYPKDAPPGTLEKKTTKRMENGFWKTANRIIIVIDREPLFIMESPSGDFASAPGKVARALLPLPFLAFDLASGKKSSISACYKNKIDGIDNALKQQLEGLFKKSTDKTIVYLSPLPSSSTMMTKNTGDFVLRAQLKIIFFEEQSVANYYMTTILRWQVGKDIDNIIVYNNNEKKVRSLRDLRALESMAQLEGNGYLCHRSNIYPGEKWLANDGQLMAEEMDKAMKSLIEALRQELFPT
jgi:hypothetical protein